MEKIEFNIQPSGVILYHTAEKPEPKRLHRFCTAIWQPLRDRIEQVYPGAWARLCILYPGGKGNRAAQDKTDFLRVERFIRCNLSENDELSFDVENDILHMEEVRCPLRGICPNENVICKPQGLFNLSAAEREVVNLYCYGYTFDEIAEILGKNRSTVKSQLNSVKGKIGARNCREIIKVMRINNL